MLDLIRHRAQSWGVKIIFGIIILVFVFWGVGSVNQHSPNVAALVNNKPISMVDFYNAVKAQEQQYLAAGFSQEQVKSLQLPQMVLQSLVSRAVLQQEAERLGVGISEKELQNFILSFPMFQKDGRFDRDTYDRVMSGQGTTTAEAEKTLAADLLMDKFRNYIAMAATVSPEEARLMHAFQAERRTVSYVLFALEDYLDQVNVTEEQLLSFYNGNAQRFSFPDRTGLRYAEFTPTALAPVTEVSEEAIDRTLAAGPTRYRLGQVLFILPGDADDAARNAARETLETLRNEIAGGMDLTAAVAAASAEDPAVVGGDAGWVNATQMDEGMLAAVTPLAKGALTEIFEVPAGYAFLRLEETDPDFSLPESQVRAAVRATLAEETALVHFHETREKIIESMDLGKSLDDIAAAFGLVVHELPVTSRAVIPSALGLKAGISASLFGGAEGALVPNVLETEDGFIVAAITRQLPAGPIPFEDVRAEIEQEVRRIEAARLAEKDADSHLAEFSGAETPAAFADRVLVSAPFMRGGMANDFGNAPALVSAAFENAPGAWIPRTFAVDKGVVIAMTREVLPLTDEEWREREAGIMRAATEGKQNALFGVYMDALNSTATISVPDPRIYDMF